MTPASESVFRTCPEEYQSLREETLKRVEFRNQQSNFTLLSAGAIFGFATAQGMPLALFAFPLLVIFFAANYSYNTMMLITLGRYLREVIEKEHDFGWATFLSQPHGFIERFERVEKYGLFVAIPTLMMAYGYFMFESLSSLEQAVLVAGILAVGLTIVVLRHPEHYHARVLAKAPLEGDG